MPAFFFHFLDGSERADDDAGIEFASAEHAYLEAVAGARGMWTDLLAEGRDPTLCAFEIVDTRGTLLFRVDFGEAMRTTERSRAIPTPGAARLIRALHDTHQRAAVARAELASSLLEVRRSLAESRGLLSRLKQIDRAPRPARAIPPAG